jgi:hypothetical protein
MTKIALSSQPGVPARLVPKFDRAVKDLQRLGPMKHKLFIKYYSQELLTHLLQSRDVKLRDSHLGGVVVLNIYKYPKHYETYHTINTLTSSLILRAGLEQLCDSGIYELVSRSSTSAWISRDGKISLMLARMSQPKVKAVELLLDRLKEKRPHRLIIVVPKKRRNYFGRIKDYKISILELGQSFLPVYDQGRR